MASVNALYFDLSFPDTFQFLYFVTFTLQLLSLERKFCVFFPPPIKQEKEIQDTNTPRDDITYSLAILTFYFDDLRSIQS